MFIILVWFKVIIVWSIFAGKHFPGKIISETMYVTEQSVSCVTILSQDCQAFTVTSGRHTGAQWMVTWKWEIHTIPQIVTLTTSPPTCMQQVWENLQVQHRVGTQSSHICNCRINLNIASYMVLLLCDYFTSIQNKWQYSVNMVLICRPFFAILGPMPP